MGTQKISKMKLIATLAAVASASQFTGVREEDGVQYSAVVTDSAVAYQEGGQSFVAMAMEGQATTEDGLGMHALCYAEGSNLPEGTPQCKTVAVRYSNWSWDGSDFTAKGSDDMGLFEITDGYVEGGRTHFTKTWYDGKAAGLVATATIETVPNDQGLMYGPFSFTTNAGTSGAGRFAAAFVDNAQFSFDDSVNPLPEE